MKEMNEMQMRDAVIFDLDGTLWDATGCSSDIWQSMGLDRRISPMLLSVT